MINRMNSKNFLLQFQNLFYFWILQKDLAGCKSVLDVGCGYDSPIAKISKKFRSEGIDVYKKTLEKSRKINNYDKYTLGDIRNLSKIYTKKSFDACVSIDVIEHLSKKDALKLIHDMEKVARKMVIILTPNGFYEQHDYEGNPHHAHLSGWKESDLTNLGYRVVGMRGLKYLRNDHAGIKYKPWIFWGALSFITEILLHSLGSLSFDLYAKKDLR